MVMSSHLCNEIMLKASDCISKKAPFMTRMCSESESGIEEDVPHMLMQCPGNEDNREELLIKYIRSLRLV